MWAILYIFLMYDEVLNSTKSRHKINHHLPKTSNQHFSLPVLSIFISRLRFRWKLRGSCRWIVIFNSSYFFKKLSDHLLSSSTLPLRLVLNVLDVSIVSVLEVGSLPPQQALLSAATYAMQIALHELSSMPSRTSTQSIVVASVCWASLCLTIHSGGEAKGSRPWAASWSAWSRDDGVVCSMQKWSHMVAMLQPGGGAAWYVAF